MADKSVSIEGEDRKNQNPLVSILHNIQLNFPQFKKETKPSSTTTTNVEPASKPKPDVVRVPEGRKDYPSLKLEGEESQEPAGTQYMWQVYALGGFMIARWLWARWNEKKKKAGNTSGKQQPAPDDEPPSQDN